MDIKEKMVFIFSDFTKHTYCEIYSSNVRGVTMILSDANSGHMNVIRI